MISKDLIDSYVNHDEFVSGNDVLREYNETKEEIKNPEIAVEYTIWKQWKLILSVVRKMLEIKNLVSEKLKR